MKHDNVRSQLDLLAARLKTGSPQKAELTWGGAHVIITTDQPPPPAANAFYPEPRYVVTQFARELSWMFEALRDIFFDAELIDGATKIEFFGRLANASQRQIQETGASLKSEILLGAVLHEAYGILEESRMESFLISGPQLEAK